MKFVSYISITLATLVLLSACQQAENPEGQTTFIVTIENIASGDDPRSPLSPGVAIVGAQGTRPLFTEGEVDRGEGLKEIAEVGNPDKYKGGAGYILFDTPSGASGRAPIRSGGAYRFEVRAGKDSSLSFATMLEYSKDTIIAPQDTGIPLFDATGIPVTGDISAQLRFWDVGTKDNTTGARESKPVATVETAYTLNKLVKVTLSVKE